MSSDLELMDDIVGEARVDWIDMGHAIGIVALAEPDDDDRELRQRAGALLVQLVRDGRLVAGEAGSAPGEFVPWPSTSDDSARLLEQYLAEVADGTRPFEPWQPCLFAAV